MKHLMLLRHGEANLSSPTQDDRDRVLTPAGIAASKMIGNHISAQGLAPDLAMCSSAVRARTTWEIVLDAMNLEVAIEIRDDLYLADPALVLSIAATAPPSCGTLILVGHNPGFATLVQLLTGEAAPGALAAVSLGFPTTGLAVFNLDIENWRDLPTARGRLASFVRP